MALKWPSKDPDEVLDYSLLWDEELPRLEDAVFSSSWRILNDDGSLIIDSDGIHASQHVTFVWLSGGTPEQSYEVINTIVTDKGRTYERSAQLKVRQR